MIKINEISNIGIGAYRMEDTPEYYKTLKYAIDSGINIIDSASNYNFGNSEKLIGQTITSDIREKVFIISKVGYIQGNDIKLVKEIDNLSLIEFSENFYYSLDPKFISFQLKQSLKRLNTEYIDCYLLHNPEYYFNKGYNKEQIKDIIFASFSLLEREVEKGKIRFYGISCNDFNKIPIIEILESIENFPAFKFVQFPFNIVENNLSDYNVESCNLTIKKLKEYGLFTLSNRPLNTVYQGKTLRLTDMPSQDIESINQKEEMLFDSFQNTIKESLVQLGEDTDLENYYPIFFFVENRKNIANVEAIDKAIYEYLLPFLDALNLRNAETTKLITELRNYWIIYTQWSNQERLNILKQDMIKEHKMSATDKRDFSHILADYYLNKEGVDCVLMGLRKTDYVDKVKSLLL